MIATLLVLASSAEGEEPSKTLFYVLGAALAVWAVVVSAVGIARHETFPPSRGVAVLVMAVSTVLVAGAMASAVITG